MAQNERVTFDPNTPVKLTFAYDGGKEFTSQFDDSIQTMYSFTDGRVLFAPADLAVKVNYCEPKRGDTLWITKRVQWVKGRRKNQRMTSWDVSREEPGVIRRDGYNDTRANAAAMGIEESDLERQLRESREIREKAATRQQRPAAPAPHVDFSDVVNSTLATDAAPVERKEPQKALSATESPNGQHPNWYEPLVSQTKQLVDALAEVRTYAGKHGTLISADDVEKLLVTCLIGKQRQRA